MGVRDLNLGLDRRMLPRLNRERQMYQGQLVFTQPLDHLPRSTFRRLVHRYSGKHRVRSFTCWHEFACIAFAHLTFRESLRAMEACLRAVPEKLSPGVAGPRGSQHPGRRQ